MIWHISGCENCTRLFRTYCKFESGFLWKDVLYHLRRNAQNIAAYLVQIYFALSTPLISTYKNGYFWNPFFNENSKFYKSFQVLHKRAQTSRWLNVQIAVNYINLFSALIQYSLRAHTRCRILYLTKKDFSGKITIYSIMGIMLIP